MYQATGVAEIGGSQVLRGGKPPFLVKLAVVGQVLLGHHAQYLTFLDNRGAVEQQVANGNGKSDDRDDVELARKVEQHEHGCF